MIPISDLTKQHAPIRKEIEKALAQILDNCDFILGKESQLLEKDVSSYCEVKFAVGVSNGTDAIRLALVVLGIKPGDGVICPAFTYYATAGAVSSIGAIPVFCDINPETYTISIPDLEKILNKKSKISIKAVIPVHLYGQCADMDPILKIARKYKIAVIEDNAQAFGAKYKNKFAGTIGDCGTLSFYPGKNLGACGDAGMVLTNRQDVYEKILLYRNQGNKEKYFHTVLGFNHRMDTIQAAILRIKLKYIDKWNRKRVQIASYFDKGLKNTGIHIPKVAGYNTHIYHQYVLRMNTSSDNLIAYLRENGIDARVYYPVPLHLQECFKYLGYVEGDFPVSEEASKNILAIPVYPDLTPVECRHIIKTIKEFLCRKK